MPPKTPRELHEQAERQNADNPPAPGHSRTSEGLEIPNPSRQEFLSNIDFVSQPEDDSSSDHDRLSTPEGTGSSTAI